MKMARVYLFPTDTKRLFYKLNQDKEKVYVAKFQYGKKNYNRVLSKSKQEALKLLKELLSTLERAKKKDENNLKTKLFATKLEYSQNPKNMTLTELFKEYMHVDGLKLSVKEQKTRISRFNNWIAPKLGKRKFINLKYKDVQLLINDIDDSDSLNRKTQSHIKSTISALYTYASRNEYYDKVNPCTYVEILPYDNHRNLPIDKDGVKRLFKAILDIDNQQYRMIYLFLMHGRRLKEVLHLEYEDIDFIDHVHTIPAHKSKTRKTQKHMMTKLLQTQLYSYLNAYDIKKGYIFINPKTDEPYTCLKRFFSKLKRKADITQDFQTTDFRHIIGTFVRKICDLPLEDARDTLGHGSILTTEKFYEDIDSKTSKDTCQAIFDELGI
jgi:integrase